MTDFLWLFGAVLAGALGVHMLKNASYWLNEWELTRAIGSWLTGAALVALALWCTL